MNPAVFQHHEVGLLDLFRRSGGDLENVTSVLVTHQLRDAFYVATHAASPRSGGGIDIEAAAEAKLQQADFVMLRDARIVFEGSADELRQSRDPYLKAFLS